MPAKLALRCAALAAMLSAAASARAAGLRIEGGERILTVSGEPLLAYHLVEPGRALIARVDGPLVLSLKVRRHSRSRHGGTARAVLALDGGEMDRFVLEARPPGRYLAGFGFMPGPETTRQIKLGPGSHRITIRASAGSIVVAFSSAPEDLPAAPLIAELPPRPRVHKADALPPPAPPTAAAELVTSNVVERSAPEPALERAPHCLLELRAGSATQPQVGSTGFSGGADARWYLSSRFSLGLGVDGYAFSLGQVSASASREAVSPLSENLSILAVPVFVEGAYDQPLGGTFVLTLGLGAGADYQRFSRSVSAGPTALPAPPSESVAPMGEALAALSLRAPGGRVGLDLRLSSSVPQDIDGVARGVIVGALLAEVGYQFLL